MLFGKTEAWKGQAINSIGMPCHLRCHLPGSRKFPSLYLKNQDDFKQGRARSRLEDHGREFLDG